MAKREQVVAEELEGQQAVEEPAQEAEKELRSIAQARAVYEQLMDEFVVTVSKLWSLREQVADLKRSGRTDFQVRGRDPAFDAYI